MSGSIFFLGNALLDMSLLQKCDLKPDENSDAANEKVPLLEYLLNCPDALLSPGGSAQNSARVAQWVLNSRGKGQATFAGCIGNDVYGEKLKAFLYESKVKALYYCHPSASTGIISTLVTNDGTRSSCSMLGAAKLLDNYFLFSSEGSLAIKHADYVYIEGYFVSHSPLCALDVSKMVKDSAKQLAVNLSAVYICERHFEQLNSCVSLANIVIGNKREAEAFLQKHGLPNESIETCAKMIASLPGHHKPQIVVITQGPDPVVVHTSHNLAVRYYDVPAVKELGDTIGCGDAFVGGFLALLSIGMSVEDAVKYGIYCAVCIAQQRGCTIPPFDAE